MGRSFVQVNRLRIGLEQRGTTVENAENAPVLVLLHGFTGSAAGWGALLDKLALQGMRVIALDMPGHGHSDAPTDPRRYDMEHCRADIIAVLRELGVREGQALLLGYSMGGRIALYTAFWGFFRALILESASPGLADPAEREQRRASDEALAARIEREGIPALVAYWEQLPLFASQRNLPPAQQAALHAQRLQNSAYGLAQSLRSVGTGAQPPLHDRLPNLRLPTLLIAGALDTKFSEIAREMAQALPDARLRIVPEAGHTVHLEQSEQFVNIVSDFCQCIHQR